MFKSQESSDISFLSNFDLESMNMLTGLYVTVTLLCTFKTIAYLVSEIILSGKNYLSHSQNKETKDIKQFS